MKDNGQAPLIGVSGGPSRVGSRPRGHGTPRPAVELGNLRSAKVEDRLMLSWAPCNVCLGSKRRGSHVQCAKLRIVPAIIGGLFARRTPTRNSPRKRPRSHRRAVSISSWCQVGGSRLSVARWSLEAHARLTVLAHATMEW